MIVFMLCMLDVVECLDTLRQGKISIKIEYPRRVVTSPSTLQRLFETSSAVRTIVPVVLVHAVILIVFFYMVTLYR